MYTSHIRYLAVAFVDALGVSPTPDETSQLMRTFGFLNLIPNAFAEATPSGITNRIGFTSPDNTWQFLLLSNQFLLQKKSDNPLGINLGDLNEFCRHASTMFRTVFDLFQRRPHRLAILREGYLQDMNDEVLNVKANRLLRLPTGFENTPLFEWDWRIAAEREKEFGGLQERCYFIATIKRLNIQVNRLAPTGLTAPESNNRIRVDFDLNTAATNTVARFENQNIEAFYNQAAGWQREYANQIWTLLEEEEE